MMCRLRQLRIPGASTPCIIEHRDGYVVSPFVKEIVKAALPKKLNLPILTTTYDVSTDSMEHVVEYKQRVWEESIPWHLVEACNASLLER